MSAAHAGSTPCIANSLAVGVYAGRSLNGLIALVQSPSTSTTGYFAINADGTIGASLGAMTPKNLNGDAWYNAATPVVSGAAAVQFNGGGSQLGTVGATIVATQPCDVGCHNMSYAFRATNALVVAFNAAGSSSWPAALTTATLTTASGVNAVVQAMVRTLRDVGTASDPAAYWVSNGGDWVSVRQCQATINRVHAMCRAGSLGPVTGLIAWVRAVVRAAVTLRSPRCGL